MLLRAYLNVLRWTLSKITESFLRCGGHIGEQYFSIGHSKLLRNFDYNLGFLGPTIQLINLSMLFALFAHLLVGGLNDTL